MKNLLEIWNSSELQLNHLLQKKYHKKQIIQKKIILAEKFKNSFSKFDQTIINHTNFSYLDQDEELYNIYKVLDLKLSFNDIDSIDDDTVFYIFKNYYSNQELKTQLSLILYNEKLVKEKYDLILEKENYKEIMTSSDSLNEGYLKMKKCKFNDYDENHYPIDPITHETLEEGNLEMNGRCYNKKTIENLIKTSGKDPFTRESIPEEIMKLFPDIEYEDEYEDELINVYMNNEGLEEIPANIGNNIGLLNLSENEIRSIPEEWDPKNIQELNLLSNEIEKIPEEWDHKNIEYLYLSNNKIKEIPEGWDPKNIMELRLYNNQIKKIPEGWNPKNIQSLDLCRNQIKEIPEEWDPKNIKELNLSNNKIKEIPFFWDPKNIKILKLDNNEIERIPEGWDSKNIEILYLSNNKITEIPYGWNLKNIKRLYLYGNKINIESLKKFREKHPNPNIGVFI